MSAQDHPSEVDMLGDSETHLFLLRVWARSGDTADEEQQWCGKLQEVVSTRGGYFADWATLVELLRKMLPGRQLDAGATGEIHERASTDRSAITEENPQ